MIVQTLPITRPQTLRPVPLTPSSFSPFGSVITNPHPTIHPSTVTTPDQARRHLTSGGDGISANQGTAIQYRAIAPNVPQDLHSDPDHLARLEEENAGAGTSLLSNNNNNRRQPATPRLTMFVCASRAPVPSSSSSSSSSLIQIPIPILERHPFTTQTFIPLGGSSSSSSSGGDGSSSSTDQQQKAYLVIVAPTLPPGVLDEGLPVPGPVETPDLPLFSSSSSSSSSKKKEEKEKKNKNSNQLPGRGLPDLDNLQAFISVGGNQAVTYGPGTWHAPMIALGPESTAMEFVVLQYGNGVEIEACQEVVLESGGVGEGEDKEKEKKKKQIVVRVTAEDIEKSGSGGGEKSRL